VSRTGFTLIEILLVCIVVGVLTSIATPRIRATLDSFAVEGAARDVANTFALARLAALRHRGADVRLDTLTVSLRAGGRVIHSRDIARTHGVRMRVTTALVRYAATGMATGLSNGSVILSRGSVVDTVVISRLGRVRR
jgi:prepilin-type N-terminal cleavage/methylation domain-containing protein